MKFESKFTSEAINNARLLNGLILEELVAINEEVDSLGTSQCFLDLAYDDSHLVTGTQLQLVHDLFTTEIHDIYTEVDCGLCADILFIALLAKN